MSKENFIFIFFIRNHMYTTKNILEDNFKLSKSSLDPYLGKECHMVEDIKFFLASHVRFSCVYAARDANKVAHLLAKYSVAVFF